jgi:hypothetical protein
MFPFTIRSASKEINSQAHIARNINKKMNSQAYNTRNISKEMNSQCYTCTNLTIEIVGTNNSNKSFGDHVMVMILQQVISIKSYYFKLITLTFTPYHWGR